ncbi:MAG: 50S ribosomal protein L15 [Candidatus Omnitrophica bacterium 4484_70.2]|nr:MAG: 50S ribosomal protein L15 [Candidatus Omnitrophica bacterium 4484_70.2]
MELFQLRGDKKGKKKRVGRGSGSGCGKTSCRGHKGTGQRKGRMYYIGFLGGNVPYLRKIPKRGFNPERRREYQIVNLKDIVKKLDKEKEITPCKLKEVNLIKDENKPIKILAELENKKIPRFLVKAHKFSKKAEELIKKAGGSIECLKV